jgi:hypothetical protein
MTWAVFPENCREINRDALQNPARIAREIVSFRHPRISAMKLAVADPNADLLRGDMTADEMREIIRRKLRKRGYYRLGKLSPPTRDRWRSRCKSSREQIKGLWRTSFK